MIVDNSGRVGAGVFFFKLIDQNLQLRRHKLIWFDSLVLNVRLENSFLIPLFPQAAHVAKVARALSTGAFFVVVISYSPLLSDSKTCPPIFLYLVRMIA